MSRADLANYLGLSIETVSRTLGKLQCDGMIVVHGRQVKLIQLEQLKTIAGLGLN